MFLDELSPIFRELTKEPVAFFGGFFSGVLRLNLYEDPVKSWLDQQVESATPVPFPNDYTNGNGPQSISIE
ncbi:MAG: hypothetical protein F6K32_13405 [Desertifilum sp. SIO1I2]|nr:hypothetical protein [Desertifilum sp. SIO1I2]